MAWRRKRGFGRRSWYLVPTPLREKKLKKEIIDAWVKEWQRANRPKPTESSIIADITSLLSQLSEDGLRRIQAEVNSALSAYNRG
jgi:hypothetical protein